MPEEKQELLQRLLIELRDQLSRLEQASKAAHDYASDPESKAENKYDTRGLEASYLAAGQAEEASKLSAGILALEDLTLPALDESSAIEQGALVEADHEETLKFFFLLPAGGGVTLTHLGCEVIVLTPETPLYQGLLEKRVGDQLDDQALLVLDLL